MPKGAAEAGAGGGGKAPARSLIVADGALRIHMLEFHADIGLMPSRFAEPKRKRGKTRSIFDETVPTPKGLLDCFPEEVAAARRLGRPVNKSHALELGQYRVFCLMYFSYDGLCAMLYVEHDGEFLAAWCERETGTALSPHPVWVGGAESDLLAFLRQAFLSSQAVK